MVVLSSIGTTYATANWGSVAGADSYHLQIATGSGGTPLYSDETISGTLDVFTGLTPATNYWVQVTALDVDSNPIDGTASIWTPFTTL